MKTLHVEVDPAYPIYIEPGCLDRLGHYLKEHQLTDRLFLITDDNVEPLHAKSVLSHLAEQGFETSGYAVPAGEAAKSAVQSMELYTWLLEERADRGSIILALGGGVVGDLAGFVAATFMRGIRFVQIPTTLLSQVDSSVGGKVGINHPLGKNLIGAFHQPQFVLMDSDVLQTLPRREIRAGMAEVIKYGFIRDADFLQRVATGLEDVINLKDIQLLQDVLLTSCAVKADVVRQDEKEAGLRAILNFGHTVGHALETVTGYEKLLHGEAVAHGMIAALALSHFKGFLSETELEAHVELIQQLTPPQLDVDITPYALTDAMRKDKKRTRAGQTWVLLHPVGNAILTRDVDDDNLQRAIQFMLNA